MIDLMQNKNQAYCRWSVKPKKKNHDKKQICNSAIIANPKIYRKKWV